MELSSSSSDSSTNTEPTFLSTVTITDASTTTSPDQDALFTSPEGENTSMGQKPMSKVAKLQAFLAAPAASRKLSVLRWLRFLPLLAVFVVMIIERQTWYSEYGWPAWLRHPLGPFKAQLESLEAGADIGKAKTELRHLYKLLEEESRVELLKLAADAWTRHINQSLQEPEKLAKLVKERGSGWVGDLQQLFGPGGDRDKRELRALEEAKPIVRDLMTKTGPLADGLDWWLALGGGILAYGCFGLLMMAAGEQGRCLELEWREWLGRWLVLPAAAVALLVCLVWFRATEVGQKANSNYQGLGSVYAVWEIQAALDVFGAFLVWPLLYSVLFFTAGGIFLAELACAT